MSPSQPSKFWPVLKRSAKLVNHVKIPGTDLTFDKVIDLFAGIQDDITKNKWEDDVKTALDGVRDNSAEMVTLLGCGAAFV